METSMHRDEAICRIRKVLKARTGVAWSVKGGRGTDWGWITVLSMPRRLSPDFGYMTDEDRSILGNAMGLGEAAHCQGVDISPENHGRMVAAIEN